MGLIERVKSVATAMKETTADDEEHELHPTHESKTNFVTPHLPIMKIKNSQFELGFYIYTPVDSRYKPSINAQWFLKNSSGDTKILQEYASTKSGLRDQLATIGLIEESVQFYEEAGRKTSARESLLRDKLPKFVMKLFN
jgi:hypothetical protein